MSLHVSFFPPLYFSKRARCSRLHRRLRYFITTLTPTATTAMNTISTVVNRDIEVALYEGGYNVRPLRETVNQASRVRLRCSVPIPRRFFALLILLLSFHRWLKIWRSIWRFAMQFLCISLLFFSISALRGHRARVFTFLFSGVNISLYQKGEFWVSFLFVHLRVFLTTL